MLSIIPSLQMRACLEAARATVRVDWTADGEPSSPTVFLRASEGTVSRLPRTAYTLPISILPCRDTREGAHHEVMGRVRVRVTRADPHPPAASQRAPPSPALAG